MEFKRRTVACWKLEDERSRVGSYKKNNSVLEVTRRTAACWQLQAKRQRSIKHVLQGSRRTRTQTTGRYYTPPHPTPPVPADRKPVWQGTPKNVDFRNTVFGPLAKTSNVIAASSTWQWFRLEVMAGILYPVLVLGGLYANYFSTKAHCPGIWGGLECAGCLSALSARRVRSWLCL